MRLYLLAYLRGLLKPDYEMGVRSVLRENLILQALSSELDADILKHSVSVRAVFLASAEQRQQHFSKLMHEIQSIRQRMEFGLTAIRREVDEAQKLFEALERSGFLSPNTPVSE